MITTTVKEISAKNISTGVISDIGLKCHVVDSVFKEHSLAFVDGSYNAKTNTYGWGGFLVDKFGKKHILQGFGEEPELAKMRNVAGEILGASAAIQTALKLGMEKLTIYYDYEGVEKWVTGKWRTQKKGTMDYAALGKSAMKSGLKLYFKHVKAHSGVPFNEEADNLAKKSVGLG